MQKAHKHPNQIGDQKQLYCAVKEGHFLHHFVAINEGNTRVYGWRCQGCRRLVPVNTVARRY